jgi:hypothetical protein
MPGMAFVSKTRDSANARTTPNDTGASDANARPAHVGIDSGVLADLALAYGPHMAAALQCAAPRPEFGI